MFDTPRLTIRHWKESDAAAFLELSSDRGLKDNAITVYRVETLKDAKEWIAKNPHKWAVCEKTSAKVIGLCGITPILYNGEFLQDVTYRISESFWGRGLGPELAHGVIEYGLSILKLPELTVTVTKSNEASSAIARKLGFIFDAEIILYGVPTLLFRLKG